MRLNSCFKKMMLESLTSVIREVNIAGKWTLCNIDSNATGVQKEEHQTHWDKYPKNK